MIILLITKGPGANKPIECEKAVKERFREFFLEQISDEMIYKKNIVKKNYTST